jgi:hypothetical protein
MPQAKTQFAAPVPNNSGDPGDHLRRWIELVIVPLLVKEFVRTQGLQNEGNDG